MGYAYRDRGVPFRSLGCFIRWDTLNLLRIDGKWWERYIILCILLVNVLGKHEFPWNPWIHSTLIDTPVCDLGHKLTNKPSLFKLGDNLTKKKHHCVSEETNKPFFELHSWMVEILLFGFLSSSLPPFYLPSLFLSHWLLNKNMLSLCDKDATIGEVIRQVRVVTGCIPTSQ